MSLLFKPIQFGALQLSNRIVIAPMCQYSANAQGELIFMDEAARNAELKRAQAIIDSDCKR